MSVRQLSVFLENKPGTLAQLTDALAAAGVNMRALSLAETNDFGIARIIADDTVAAMTVLRDAGMIATLTPVLAYAIPNEAGGLNKLLAVFNDAGVNIVYMYSCLSARDNSEAVMIFRTADPEAAEAALAARGLLSISQEEL